MFGGVYNPQYRVHIEDTQGTHETSEVITSASQVLAMAREFRALGYTVWIESISSGFWHEIV